MLGIYVAILATMLIWAGSFVAIKIALKCLDPFNLAFYRFLIASPILFLIYRPKPPDIRDLPCISVLAMSGVTLLYIVQFIALKLTTATRASILINTSAIFTAIISYAFLKERFTTMKSLGVLIAFAGVVLIVSGGLSISIETIGDLLMIFDGFLWSIYTVLGKVMLRKYNPEDLTTYAFMIGTLLLFPFAVLSGLRNILTVNTDVLLSILYLSILCSVFAYVIWYRALLRIEATELAVFIYLIPLFTAIMAFFILNESIRVSTIIGGILTIAGVSLVEIKK